MDLQLALILLQGLWGLVLTILAFLGRSLLNDLKSNTQATSKVATSLHELHTLLVDDFAKKAAVEKLDAKYDALNREMGELQSRVGYAVKHKEY